MLNQVVGGLRQRVADVDAAVGPDFQHELVVVGALANAGIFHAVGHAADGHVHRIQGQSVDGLVGGAGVSRDVALADFGGHHHVQAAAAGTQRADGPVGVDHFHVGGDFDVAGNDGASLVGIQAQVLRVVAGGFQHDAFQVEQHVQHVLGHAGDGGELVGDAVNAYGGNGAALQAGQQDAAQGVAHGGAVSALQRLNDELAINGTIGIGGGVYAFDIELVFHIGGGSNFKTCNEVAKRLRPNASSIR